MIRSDGKNRTWNLLDYATEQGCSGLNAQTEKPGQLNPEFVCWLMGYSTAHHCSMLSAMQLFRKSRQSSSKQREDDLGEARYYHEKYGDEL